MRLIFQQDRRFQQASSSMQSLNRNLLPKSVYNLQKTLFEKLDVFNIENTKEQTLFKNVAIFDFESFCMPSGELKSTETIISIGKNEPNQCQFPQSNLANPYFCVSKIHNPTLLTLWRTWNCLPKKLKPKCDQSFWKLTITAKSSTTRFSASLMNKAVSTRAKQEIKKTNVSRMRKKQTRSLTFSGFKKLNWLI